MLTKREKELLKSRKMIVEKVEEQGSFLQFQLHVHLTQGQLMVVADALRAHSNDGSAIANDLLAFLTNAADRAGINLK